MNQAELRKLFDLYSRNQIVWGDFVRDVEALFVAPASLSTSKQAGAEAVNRFKLEAFALRFSDDPRLNLSTIFDTKAEAQKYAERVGGNTEIVPMYAPTSLAVSLETRSPMPAAPSDAVMDAIQSAENILDRVALSVGTSTTAEKEREWRDAARIAIGGIRWELSRAALSQTNR